jgi:NDP-sugar pyrophosphorylase family protein
MDRPSLDHVLDHLARHEVHDVILSSPYLEEMFDPFIESRHGDPEITWITETEPLGTGGAIVHALATLADDQPFFALNGDILTDLDLTAMLALHRERGALATIAMHHVEDARAFGLIHADPDGRVRGVPGESPTTRSPATSTPGRTCWIPSCSRRGPPVRRSRSSAMSSRP